MLDVLEGQRLQYKNVVFKSYTISPGDFDIAVSDFKSILNRYGVTLAGDFFFTIESPLDEKIYDMTLFSTIRENYFQNEADSDIGFHTYFSVNNLLKARAIDESIGMSQLTYLLLLSHLAEKNSKVCTPFFNVIKCFDGNKYCDIYIGVLSNEN